MQQKLMSEFSPMPLARTGLSLQEDMKFGWKPKLESRETSMIPLCFGLVSYNMDDLIKPERIIYVGPRYQNSYQVH